MKKVFGLLAAAAVLSSGVSFAQITPPASSGNPSQSHDVNIKIPNVLGIRLTNGTSNVAVADPTPVSFVLNDGQLSFDGGEFVPSNQGEGNWDDVKVFSNVTGFNVEVGVTNGLGFDWTKVSVAANGGLASPFTLGALNPNIVTGAAKTNAWTSLGFGPDDFKLTLNGSEDAGDYSTTVTYTISLP